MGFDAPKVSQNAAVSTVFLFTEGEKPLPATVFYQTDSEWIAGELCKLFRAEYGQNRSDTFRFVTVLPECVTDFVRLQSAISDLSLYQDPDPGIYDPEPTSDLLLRASYCVRAQEWEDALRHLLKHARRGTHGKARPLVPQDHPTSKEVDAFEAVRNSLEKHRLMFLYFAAPKRLNPTATGNRWEMETMSKDKFPIFDPDEIDESGEFLITHRRRLESFVQSAYSQFGSGTGCKPRVMTESGTVVDVEGGSFPAWYLDEAACVHLDESAENILASMRDAIRKEQSRLLQPFIKAIKDALHDQGKSKWYASEPVRWEYVSRLDSILHDLRTFELEQLASGTAATTDDSATASQSDSTNSPNATAEDLLTNTKPHNTNVKADCDITKTEEPQQSTTNSNAQIAIPLGAKWSEVAIRFLDAHNVQVTFREQSQRFHFTQMNMADGRSNLKPTKQWDLLYSFARDNGVINWGSRSASSKMKKQKQELSEKLSSLFAIVGEPIVYLDEEKGWKTVFQISDS